MWCSSPVLCLHVVRLQLLLNDIRSINIALSDAFTKKCHVPWTFTYRFMVYEYVSHREQPREHQRACEMVLRRWHSRCRVLLWAHGLNVPVLHPWIYTSPPCVLAHTAGGDIHAASKTFTVQSRDGKAEISGNGSVRKDPAGTIQWRQSFRGWRALRVTIFPFHDTTRTLKWNTSSYIFYLVISSDSIKWKGF